MMINPIKDFLKPKYVVGLQVKDGFIGAVQLYVGLKGPEIEKAVFIEMADPERLQEELSRLFQEQGFKKEMIVTSLKPKIKSRQEFRHVKQLASRRPRTRTVTAGPAHSAAAAVSRRT